MKRNAEFSGCRRYRYALWREWTDLLGSAETGYVMFVGLNPSTADETNDDPTITRCINFARSWGYSGLCMTNLFAFRATLPADMIAHPDPVGPENDARLIQYAKNARLVVAAWGAHGAHLGRDAAVRRLLPNLHYLRLTRDGHPGHPLYLPRILKPLPFRPDSAAGATTLAGGA